jgi:hypothetical protein
MSIPLVTQGSATTPTHCEPHCLGEMRAVTVITGAAGAIGSACARMLLQATETAVVVGVDGRGFPSDIATHPRFKSIVLGSQVRGGGPRQGSGCSACIRRRSCHLGVSVCGPCVYVCVGVGVHCVGVHCVGVEVSG